MASLTLEFPPVRSKADFVRRYAAGEFGNCSPTWTRPGDLYAWGCREYGACPPGWSSAEAADRFHLRNGTAGGSTLYNLYWSEAVGKWYSAPDPAGWYVSMMAPTPKTVLQGEVMQAEPGSGHYGLYLYYSTVTAPMRDALRIRSAEASGVLALALLKNHLCPNSYEWLNVLLDRYPGHVVEFSAYSTRWGTLYPRYNTCFWEVRQY